MKVVIGMALLCAGVSAWAAQSQPIRNPGAASTGDSGQKIATQGVNGAPCASCHGANGEGVAASGFPRIAGQSAWYLERQLEAYANGSRENQVMMPIAKALSVEQRRAVAAYYAGLQTPAKKGQASAPAGGSAAARLATVGDEKRQIQACANCHGPGGRGEPPNYPALAGQHANYLTAALTAWKNGTRKTDATGQMQSIAQQLTEDEIGRLSRYYASLPVPPSAHAQLMPQRSPSADATGGASGPAPGNAPARGSGSEGGSATTGGGQGPGGGGAATGSGPSGSPTGRTP